MSSTLLTVRQVAEAIGCNRSTVLRARLRLGGVGVDVGGRILYSSADVKKLRDEIRPGPGNPDFVPGNQLRLGKSSKASKPRPKSSRK